MTPREPRGDDVGPSGEVAAWPTAGRSIGLALGTTALVTAASHLLPDEHANTAVGGAFLLATWWTVLRHDTDTVRAYGMSLGGLTEPVALELGRVGRDTAKALGWALLMAAIFFPPFWYGYTVWWKVGQPFAFGLPADFTSRALGQVLVIALPEEAFFRGYLQSALDGRWAGRRRRILGAELGPGWLLASALFAVGHVLTIPNPARLGVFFPALLFGWMRARTGGVGAPVLFHAMCNLFSMWLAHGYGLG